MFDVFLYAAVATIICVMLYSVLGKDVGQGPDKAVNPEDFMERPVNQDSANIVAPIQDESQKPPSEISSIVKADPNFVKSEFIMGARMAYPMILEAYAAGDRDTLKELLTDDVYTIYAQSVSEREDNEQTQITDLGRLFDARITYSSVEGDIARISVEYEADIASALQDKEGQTIEGDPNMLIRIKEIWTFERGLKSSEPNWRLADVAPATGEAQPVDPTPDTKN